MAATTDKPIIQEFTRPTLSPNIVQAADVPDQKYIVPLDGQWLPGTDAILIGKNFTTLTNYRYADGHPEGVLGMTKINTLPLTTYLKTRSAFHFSKAQPSESHIVTQLYNTGLTLSQVSQNVTAIASAGEFDELMTLDVAATAANFAIGATVHGNTSGKSVVIVKMLTTLTYIVRSRTGAFTLGEVLHDGTNSADQGAANPTFAPYALWTDSSGSSIAQMSDAPSGQMVYCNKVDSCIWGGDEIRVGAFITSTAAITDTGAATSPKDYTDIINNTKTDAENVAVIGGGNDTYTVLLLHGDGTDTSTTITDSSIGGGGAPPKTVTASGHAQIDTAQAKFGTGSILLDGTDDFVYVDSTDADINDFYFGTGAFTIDFWVRFNALPITYQGFFQQTLGDGINRVQSWLINSGGQYRVNLVIGHTDAGTNHDFYGVWTTPVVNTWYHIAFIRGWGGVTDTDAGWKICITGSALTSVIATSTPNISSPDLNADFEIGRATSTGNDYLNGWIDEFRVSKGIARWTAAFTPPARPYSATALTWLIGSTRPLQGLKYYVSKANIVASTLTGKEWNGTTWNTLTLTDNTDTGASLAVTGTVTFASTVTTAKPKYLEGYFLYWYQFTLSAGEAELSHITLDAPFQPIIDIWDGLFRDIAKFFMFTTVYLDYTVNLRTENYITSDTTTYMPATISAFSDPNNCYEIGFTEKQTAIDIFIITANTTNPSVASMDYWNGTEYTSVGTISDGTASGDISLAKSGVISWNNNSTANETKKVVSNSGPLYYYRLKFTGAISAGTIIDYVAGIPAQKTISGYSFGIHAADRLLLGCNNYENKNEFLISAEERPNVFNGTDSYKILVGTNTPLICGTSLSTQYASNIYNMILAFKPDETWIIKWTQTDTGTEWERFRVSPVIGCPAPQTLKTVSTVFGDTGTKVIGIWRSHDGIYISNGQAPQSVSQQIKSVFDQTKTPHVNLVMLASEFSFIDHHKLEYHWCWASGSNTTLDKEYVLDLKKWQWFEFDRTSGLRLQCGCDISDTYGNEYAYGFIDTGYMERLENGTTFDGTAITSICLTGDQIVIPADLLSMTSINRANLITVAKNTESTVTFKHVIDGATSDTDYTLSAADATHRYANIIKDIFSNPGIFHQFGLSVTSSTETKGSEPLYMAVWFQKDRDHTR
jgi:hypothetical protein